MQPCRTSHAGVVVLLAISLASIPYVQGDEAGEGAWARLESVPLARREALAAKLREFAALPRDRQQAVLDLDARIASLDPTDRDRYLALLRRYHVWLQDQPDADRLAFGQGTTEERIRRIVQLEAKSRPSAASLGSMAVIEPTCLLGRSPFDLAYLIKTWQALTDDQQKQIEGPGARIGFAARARKLVELGRSLKIEVQSPPTGESERLQKRASDTIFLREFTNGVRPGRILEKAAEKQALNGKIARPLLKNAIAHLSDAFWLVENQKPVQVNEANLRRFEDAIPEWLRATFDSLPPAESRHRLALIYRLAYPLGTEMPFMKVPPKNPLLPTPVTPRSTEGVAF